MWERDLSGIWFTGEREQNISGAFDFGRERLSGADTHTERNIQDTPLRSHALLGTHSYIMYFGCDQLQWIVWQH